MPTKEELLDFSRFDANAILRGAQLTLVGGMMQPKQADDRRNLAGVGGCTAAQRALSNPGLWTTQHYRQAAIAVGCGIAIRLLIEIPIVAVKIGLWFLSFVIRLDTVSWDDTIADGLRFLQQYVLQVPLFLMTLMRHVTPAMDDLFMQSLQWVDHTYAQKHARDVDAAALVDPRRRYYENLRTYAQISNVHQPPPTATSAALDKVGEKLGPEKKSAVRFLWRFGRRAGISLAVFALSYVPIVGRFVLPATSFYTFRRAVGLGPAALIFGAGLFLPRRYLVVFLQTYYGQRSLMRELLGPYFARVHFTASQKRQWFSSREALLFGFGAGFYVLLRVPLVGVLIYGIAEASTAYLVTKITDPPPGQDALASRSSQAAAAVVASFSNSQQTWHNKKAFLDLALDNLDALQQQYRSGTTGAAAFTPNLDRHSGGSNDSAPVAGLFTDQTTGTTTGAHVSVNTGGLERPGVYQRQRPEQDGNPPPPYSADSGM
ncbi:hypothetical protein SEPCBS119000_000812 [Sporothrix epigloea]|uniref:Transmembrane protein n=1 Tax=Sporothrix epigloea TaxID=1892477 RepID=A0ABP0D8Y7_9PEZI